MSKEYTSHDIANWLLSKSSMSPKKLQKMLYYCYAWVLTLTNDIEELTQQEAADEHSYNRLFNDSFEAWVHGPVIPSIYAQYKDYGYNEIPKSDTEVTIEDPEILDILEQVFEEYNKYSGNELESISHQEDPWREARGDLPEYAACNSRISDDTIFNYYIKSVS